MGQSKSWKHQNQAPQQRGLHSTRASAYDSRDTDSFISQKSSLESLSGFDSRDYFRVPPPSTEDDRNFVKTKFNKIKHGNTEEIDGLQQLNQYKLCHTVLGFGSFAEVKLAKNVQDNQYYAVKIMYTKKMRRPIVLGGQITPLDMIENEIEIMCRIGHHPNIVRLYEVLWDDINDKLYLVLEYVNGKSVLPESLETDPIAETEALPHFRDIVCGLEYIHARQVVHRDIKPANLLISSNGIKISDFGVSAIVTNKNDQLSDTQGSTAFMAPEMCQGLPSFSGKCGDVWALGVTLFVFVFGKLPFTSESSHEIYKAINTQKLEIPTNPPVSDALKDLLRALLTKDVKERITLAEVKAHRWTTSDGKNPFLLNQSTDQKAEPDIPEEPNEAGGDQINARSLPWDLTANSPQPKKPTTPRGTPRAGRRMLRIKPSLSDDSIIIREESQIARPPQNRRPQGSQSVMMRSRKLSEGTRQMTPDLMRRRLVPDRRKASPQSVRFSLKSAFTRSPSNDSDKDDTPGMVIHTSQNQTRHTLLSLANKDSPNQRISSSGPSRPFPTSPDTTPPSFRSRAISSSSPFANGPGSPFSGARRLSGKGVSGQRGSLTMSSRALNQQPTLRSASPFARNLASPFSTNRHLFTPTGTSRTLGLRGSSTTSSNAISAPASPFFANRRQLSSKHDVKSTGSHPTVTRTRRLNTFTSSGTFRHLSGEDKLPVLPPTESSARRVMAKRGFFSEQLGYRRLDRAGGHGSSGGQPSQPSPRVLLPSMKQPCCASLSECKKEPVTF